jgi:hypothetical protein
MTNKEKVIRRAIRDGLQGSRYVDYLDICGLKTKEEWQKQKPPCSASYKKAYADPRWKQLIYKEKSRMALRMKNEQQLSGSPQKGKR